ncbi:hypothetical protein [Brevundimonas sp. DC300-4]|uniref:hypothetical protein n=1 Tax=Brevundimonas sp. DC300-4 TaxID=2804594 RepID=UPI003CEA356F
MGLQADGSWVEGQSVEGQPLTATAQRHLANHCWDEWAYRQHSYGVAISRGRWLKDWPQTRRYKQVMERLARLRANPSKAPESVGKG